MILAHFPADTAVSGVSRHGCNNLIYYYSGAANGSIRLLQQNRDTLAVSEAISFILLTAVMLSAFFIIYATGLPVYNSYIDQSHMSNIEQSFSIISYNGNTVAMHKSPFSSSELKIYGGRLATQTSGYLNVSYYGDTAGTALIGSNNTSLSYLEYSKGPDRIAYVNGAVCRYYPAGSVLLAEPPAYSTPDSLVLPSITLFNSNVAVSGNGLTRILFLTPYYSKMSQTIALPAVAAFDVKRVDIALGGDYAGCLGRYYQDNHGFTLTSGPGSEVIASRTYPSGITLQIIQSYLTVEAK